MASEKDASCANDPNFAIICAFFEKFADKVPVKHPNFKQLQAWLDNSDDVSPGLKELHIKLLRKIRRTVHETAWETALSKFCYTYSAQDAWEIERFGYKKSSLKVKLRILRELVENQFDRNNKFRSHILSLSADTLRAQPIGRDRLGHSYWVTEDAESNLRVYQEHLDEEIWQVVASSREELVKLIARLRGNEVVMPSLIGIVDEDSSSNSCVAEKPPPPEEKDESGSNDSHEEKVVPNITIKLGNGPSVLKSADDVGKEKDIDKDEEKEKEAKADRKVKPLVISQFKLNAEKSKKRQLDEASKKESEDSNAMKKKRPTLLDTKREKKVSRYEKLKDDDSEEEEGEDEEDEEEEGEEEDEGEEDEEEEEEEEESNDEEDDTSKKKKVVVGEAIEEPVMVVKGEGSGEDCEGAPFNFLGFAVDDNAEFSEVIEEDVLFVHGEGSGAECLVGSAKEDEPKATFFFGQPGCLKLSPVKKKSSDSDKETSDDKDKKDEDPKDPKEEVNGDAKEKKEDAEVEEKNGKAPLPCRKRRLSGEKVRLPSESESEVFSENVEEVADVAEEEDEVGGKRPKMRCKIVNTEIRKKVETLRKETKADTSSGSEEERPRKKIFPKRREKKEEEKKEEEENDVKTLKKEEESEDNDEEEESHDAGSVSPALSTGTSEEEEEKEEILNKEEDIVEKKEEKEQKVVENDEKKEEEKKEEETEVKEEPKPDEEEETKLEVKKEEVKEEEPKEEVEEKAKEEEKTTRSGARRLPLVEAPKKKRTLPPKAEKEAVQVSPKGKKPKTEEVKEEEKKEEPPKVERKKPGRKPGSARKEIDAKNIIDENETPVRQSRRIAQLKIREEAERRKQEEVALKKMKEDLKKKKIAAGNDPTYSEPSVSDKDDDSEPELQIKKAEKKRKGNAKNGWSSGSDEEQEKSEEEHYEESERGSPLFKSDHEFSPESEVEDESQVVPMKRARTLRKEGAEEKEDVGDEACRQCGKSDHPEWILLCDKCDHGYHCSCLSPVLFYIPEGDWFCPPCQQEQLIVALEVRLQEFDDVVRRRKEEEEEQVLALELQRKEQERVEMEHKLALAESRVAKKTARRNVRKRRNSEEEAGESDEGSEEESGSSTSRRGRSSSSSATDSDDEPIYKLRKRRQINVSYRLNEYDDMIKSALKEEDDEVAGAGNLGRGKDISTIIEAGKEEKRESSSEKETEPKSGKNIDNDSGSDVEPVKRKAKPGKKNLKKKNRKLNALDVSSEEDDSDEDFKTNSFDDDDEEEDADSNSDSDDSSLDAYRRRGKKGNRKNRRASRRSARERRKDRKFVVDDSEESDEQRPQTKKKRKQDSDYTESEEDGDDDELSEDIDSEDLCDDSSDSEVSDGAWRPSKRKKQRTAAAKKSPTTPRPKAVKKAKRVDDNERSFKASGANRNRILNDTDSDSGKSGRQTRGRRFTYLEDYDDDSSDGGIKPGVKRPDTPPEEREKFIQKQEEIKRMLAEKNTEAAKAAATPTLTPIKSKARAPGDSLSTVPMSVIRQAKALDVDYLQRKGESISDVDGENDFDDDDLPDDLMPDDVDEDAIARIMEEEDFAQHHPKKALATPPKLIPQVLQEPVRKRLPMPTIHPPLLRHPSNQPPTNSLNLLQNALSAPLGQPISRALAIPLPDAQDAVGKPRGRRKKITPLRDPVQKQQAAAAASAAAAGTPPSKSPVLSVAQAPQLYKPPPVANQPSVITRMPHLPSRPGMPAFPPEQGSRFYSPPPHHNHGHRPPLRPGGPPPQMPHHNLRPSFAGGPPPLRPVGHPVDSRQPPRPPFGPRHGAPLMNPYRPMYGPGQGYPPGPHQPNQAGPNSIRPGGPDYPPPPISTFGPGPYGYYPPPLNVPQSTPAPAAPTAAVPSSVIVRPSSTTTVLTPATTAITSIGDSQPKSTAPIPVQPSHVTAVPLIEPRKKLTTLETFNPSKSDTPPPSSSAANEAGSRSPPEEGGDESGSPTGGAPPEETSEFSGLVSYFSSQQDDLDT